ADAVDPRRGDPALRELVLGLRDRLCADLREREPRAADHRRLLHGQRALEPASRPGARVRHVRGARGDDGDLRAADAAGRTVGAMRSRKIRISPSAVIWLLVAAAYFL